MGDAEKLVRARFDALIPKITKELGKKTEHGSYELSVPNGSFFLSSMFLLTVKYGDDEKEWIKLVVKLPDPSEDLRNALKMKRQFRNEIRFYREFARGSADFPRCVLVVDEEEEEEEEEEEKDPAGPSDGGDYLIVLEDVTARGFDLCPLKVNCPLKYVVSTMRELGRFHGKAYAMKHKERDAFFAIVENLAECRYEYSKSADAYQFHTFLNMTTPRAVRYLRARGYDGDFCDKMESFLDDTFENVMLESVKPVEPLATLCHGDLTANNIMFKERKDANDLRAMLLDFALVRYSTPAIDLTTFLCLCCSNELRRAKFPDIFRSYHDALKGYLREEAGLANQDLEKYSYDSLLEDYKRRVLFGFAIATFFLPVLLGYNTMPVEEVVKLTTAESAEISCASGGDEMSEILARMLLEFKDFGCLDHILHEP